MKMRLSWGGWENTASMRRTVPGGAFMFIRVCSRGDNPSDKKQTSRSLQFPHGLRLVVAEKPCSRSEPLKCWSWPLLSWVASGSAWDARPGAACHSSRYPGCQACLSMGFTSPSTTSQFGHSGPECLCPLWIKFLVLVLWRNECIR